VIAVIQVEDALHKALGSAEPKLVVTSVSDEQKGEKLVVLHTELGVSADELLKRLRDSNLPKLWLPRKENFFSIDALPTLGSGKLDLHHIKEIAKKFAAGVLAATPATAVALRLADGSTAQTRDDPPLGEHPGHATRLLAMSDELLRQAGIAWNQIERIAVQIRRKLPGPHRQ